MIKISIAGEGAGAVAVELKEMFQDREAKGELVISVRKERIKKVASTEVDVPLPIDENPNLEIPANG